MITELGAQNFKSWKDTGELQFAPLTGFFGANCSGKTSILQVLLLLKQTTERPSDWNEPLYFGDENALANLASYGNIIHQPVGAPSLAFSLSWVLPKKMTILNICELGTLSFYFNFYNRSVGRICYQAAGHVFETTPDGPNRTVTTPVGTEPVQSLFRCYGIRGVSPKTQSIFSDFEEAFENLFSRIYHVGPIREYSPVVSAQIQPPFIDDQIPKWLQQLKLIDSYHFHHAEEAERQFPILAEAEKRYEFRVRQYEGGPEVRLTDVGFGVSQVLPVLSHCRDACEGDVLILEHPEAHLHPKAQSELADVLIDVVKNRNVQIILESHSENLLLRLTRRIAEGEISAEDMILYSCQINDGISAIEQLEMDEYGNISNWPQDFFGDSTGDLIKKTRAEMKRRKEMR